MKTLALAVLLLNVTYGMNPLHSPKPDLLINHSLKSTAIDMRKVKYKIEKDTLRKKYDHELNQIAKELENKLNDNEHELQEENKKLLQEAENKLKFIPILFADKNLQKIEKITIKRAFQNNLRDAVKDTDYKNHHNEIEHNKACLKVAKEINLQHKDLLAKIRGEKAAKKMREEKQEKKTKEDNKRLQMVYACDKYGSFKKIYELIKAEKKKR